MVFEDEKPKSTEDKCKSDEEYEKEPLEDQNEQEANQVSDRNEEARQKGGLRSVLT